VCRGCIKYLPCRHPTSALIISYDAALLGVVLAIVAHWKSEDIRDWFTIIPCQNDISFRSSLWSVMSNAPGPDYSGYKTMSPEQVQPCFNTLVSYFFSVFILLLYLHVLILC
jgi:hypothetical protein